MCNNHPHKQLQDYQEKSGLAIFWHLLGYKLLRFWTILDVIGERRFYVDVDVTGYTLASPIEQLMARFETQQD